MSAWVLYALLAAVSAAFVGIFSKVGIVGIDSTLATSLRGLIIGVFMGAAALFLGKWDAIAETTPKAFLFIFLAAIAGGLSWLWGFMALKAGGDVMAVNALDKLSLLLVVVFAILFLGEEFTWMKLFGAVMIVIGTILVSFKPEQIVRFFGWTKII
jgi:transporter family protein